MKKGKKLGIGVQTIQDFSEENLVYVDKTEKLYELMQVPNICPCHFFHRLRHYQAYRRLFSYDNARFDV
jgi:hypothetical protein